MFSGLTCFDMELVMYTCHFSKIRAMLISKVSYNDLGLLSWWFAKSEISQPTPRCSIRREVAEIDICTAYAVPSCSQNVPVAAAIHTALVTTL
jgi:hypothetical protein